MKIGYLHLGPPQHGINRYGKLLATEAKQRSELTVLEAELVLTDDPSFNREKFAKVGQQLSQADVVHIQFSYFNDLLWGTDWTQLDNLQAFVSHCSCPIVATLHDVFYTHTGLKALKTQVLPQMLSLFKSKGDRFNTRLSSLKQSVREFKINTFGVSKAALQELDKHAHLLLVSTQYDAQRVIDRVDPHKLKIIPHFVESRSLSLTPTEARKSLNLDGKIVITLIGYFYNYKGHKLLIQAMSYLPSDVEVVFVGNTDIEKDFILSLIELAQEIGVENRLRFTGYLTETELESYLIATDLAVCPFLGSSASGSISTWISVACPILTSDLPQIREYNSIEPGAIQFFNPYTPTALAAAIQQCLAMDRENQSTAVARLGQKLSLSRILDKHLACYETVSQHSHPSLICRS